MIDIKNEVEYGKIDLNEQQRAENLFGNFNNQQIKGLFSTITVAPTAPPRNFLEQIQIYRDPNTAAIRIYVWFPQFTHWCFIDNSLITPA